MKTIIKVILTVLLLFLFSACTSQEVQPEFKEEYPSYINACPPFSSTKLLINDEAELKEFTDMLRKCTFETLDNRCVISNSSVTLTVKEGDETFEYDYWDVIWIHFKYETEDISGFSITNDGKYIKSLEEDIWYKMHGFDIEMFRDFHTAHNVPWYG